MKSIALSLSLLAALAGAQTTVTENFYATISFKEFTKSHRPSSATSSGSSGAIISSSAAPLSSFSGAIISSSASLPSSSGAIISTSPTGQSPSSGIISTSPSGQSPSSGIIPTSQGFSSSGPQTGSSSQFSVPSASSSFKYSNSTSSNVVSTSAQAGIVLIPSLSSSPNPVTAGQALVVTAASSIESSVLTSAEASTTSSTTSSSSTSSTSTTTTLDSATATIILNEHNRLRSLHENTPPLTWNDDLSAWAYTYANSLKNTDYDPCSGNLLHSSSRDNQGENIAFGTYSSPEALVDYWYEEINDYDYNDITGVVHNGQDVGHFTQLVWASSTQVGCAAIECPANDGTYLLCEYTPAGNVYMVGTDDTYEEFRSNVLPLKSGA